ncbi:MAG: tRNA (adenosine(37)-N6)-threonylcarbamoyltransferase complex ATPase subunit type 1 TsaE [Bacteroidales bacterium]|nr:tRNA (adenosine(37)-N6)-threonylcarbamoyltransferase complex ATPase subunit type 1 TsaE [Bacteroidales bacterium]
MHNDQNRFVADTPGVLDEIASKLLHEHAGKKVFAFYGPLGAGKTTFIKAICNVLEVVDDVNSPTFSIINQYFTKNDETVYHFDFYRLESVAEAFDIGYEDYIYSGSYCFIEWPEKIDQLLPEYTVRVEIEPMEGTLARLVTF